MIKSWDIIYKLVKGVELTPDEEEKVQEIVGWLENVLEVDYFDALRQELKGNENWKEHPASPNTFNGDTSTGFLTDKDSVITLIETDLPDEEYVDEFKEYEEE